MQGYSSITYLNMIKTLSVAEQRKMASACLNGSHQAARKILGETRSPEDEQLRQEYIQYRSKHGWMLTNQLYERLRYGAKPAERQYLVRLVVNELIQVLGSEFSKDGDGWIFVTPMEQYFLGTRIQMSPNCIIRYTQNIMKLKTNRVGLYNSAMHNGTDILAWFELGMSEWELPCLEDAELGAKSVALVCKHLLDNCHQCV